MANRINENISVLIVNVLGRSVTFLSGMVADNFIPKPDGGAGGYQPKVKFHAKWQNTK